MDKKIKSPADLKALKEKAQADIDLRSGEKDMRIVVHMGTCGIAAGARDVLSCLMDEMQKSSIENVSIRLSGCLGKCDQEPMFTLIDKGGKEFLYADLNKTKVHEIVQQHVVGAEPVMDYVINTTQTRKEI